jgi:hypothetical protein
MKRLAYLCLVSLLFAAAAPAARADLLELGVNLISNPGAELGSSLGDGYTQLAEWTVVSGPPGSDGFSGVPWGQPGGFPTLGDPGSEPASARGTYLFAGGGNNERSSARQLLTGSTSAVQAAIDTGTVTFDLNGWLGGYTGPGDFQEDNAVLSIVFLNACSSILGTAQIGPVADADRGSQTGLLIRQETGVVPARTRTIDVRLTMTRLNGTYNDGYADNLSLILHGATVPEPNSLSLLGVGAASLFAQVWKRRRSGFVAVARSERLSTTSCDRDDRAARTSTHATPIQADRII